MRITGGIDLTEVAFPFGYRVTCWGVILTVLCFYVCIKRLP